MFCQVPGSDRAERCRSVPVSIIVADRPGNQGGGGQEIHGLMIVASDMRLRRRSGRWSAHALAATVSLPVGLPVLRATSFYFAEFLGDYFWRLSCGFVLGTKENLLYLLSTTTTYDN